MKDDYETRDWSFKWVVLYLGLVVVFLTAALPLLHYFKKSINGEALSEKISTQKSLDNFNFSKATPRLEKDLAKVYQSYKKKELEKLATYQWQDQDKKLVNIPIERAMQLALDRSLFPSAKTGRKLKDRPPMDRKD